MPQSSTPDILSTHVLICGAGAAGLTLAIDLARRGVSFRLIEKMEQPFAGSRGKAIQPRTQEIFEDLGILDRIAASGGPYPGERKYLADGSFSEAEVMESTEPTSAEPYAMPLMVPQFATEGAMRERLAELGQRAHFSTELIAFEQDGRGVTARVRSQGAEETWQARWLVGADGGRSFVRAALGIDFPGKTLGARGMVADVRLTGLSRDAWHRFAGDSPAQQISICPLAGTEQFQIQAPVPLEDDMDLSPQGLEALVAQRTGRRDIGISSVSWASTYNMNARLADRYRVDRVFLVGDAAHVHPPTGGQGLNTSVQDAYNLGWKLATVVQGGNEGLLDSYEEERRPIAADMLGLATRLLDATRQGEMRRGREVRQLDLGYAGSSLALEASERVDGLRAGDRAPDACMRGAGGQVKRMFDVLLGPHWTLLGDGVPRGLVQPRPGLRIHAIGQAGDLIDEAGHFRTAYGTGDGDWVLIRPDGYIGAIVSTAELPALETYLARLGLGSSPAGTSRPAVRQ